METTSATTRHMKVNPHSDIPSASRVPSPAKPTGRTDDLVKPSFAASSELAQKLAASPVVRTDEVTRTKALVADPNYPDDKTIHAIARQLADNIQGPSDSEAGA